ncbi:MAG: hypothetical protein JO100_10110 [Pseudonocardia sp.]|nr:hypothetical protein [Pseudonocardia sp.]
MAVPSLEPDPDGRVIQVRVAGPAVLMIAKVYETGERYRTDESRLVAKDAGDVFQLMFLE